MTPFKISHTLTNEQILAADLHEVNCIDAQGKLLWTAYSTGPHDGISTLYETPNQAYDVFIAMVGKTPVEVTKPPSSYKASRRTQHTCHSRTARRH